MLGPENDDLKVRLVDDLGKHTTAHLRKAKTKELIKARYYWPKMDKYIDRYVRNCHTCRRFHSPKDLPPGLLNPLVAVNIYGFPVIPQGYKYGFDNVLVFVDRLTKRPISVPCHKNIDARGTVSGTLSYIRVLGVIESIILVFLV